MLAVPCVRGSDAAGVGGSASRVLDCVWLGSEWVTSAAAQVDECVIYVQSCPQLTTQP